jgi:hypothetical protein
MPHSNPTMNRTTWEVGQRVARRNGGELGTVTEHDGQIKVIWTADAPAISGTVKRPMCS